MCAHVKMGENLSCFLARVSEDSRMRPRRAVNALFMFVAENPGGAAYCCHVSARRFNKWTGMRSFINRLRGYLRGFRIELIEEFCYGRPCFITVVTIVRLC
jgi:hypothetical protein